jgi:1-acyl-sn-glycerol-3-phosphate acyltransferase
MRLAFTVVTSSIRGITNLLCQIDQEQLQKIPRHGPLILVCNHINFLEAPLVFCHLQPRPLTGFAKAETWDNPFLGALFTVFDAIPLRRGEADMVALKQGLKALEQGKILAIAPEGTRSGHGQLQKGHPGVITMALHSGAPLLPLVYWGGETFYRNVRQLRRTPFHVRVGSLYRLDTGGEKVTREVRQAMTDELMAQLAQLMPPSYHGVYADRPVDTHYLQVVDKM